MNKRTGNSFSIHHVYLPFFYLVLLSVITIAASSYLLVNPNKSNKIYAISNEGISIQEKTIKRDIDINLTPNITKEITMNTPNIDQRAIKIDKFFASYGSPLATYGSKFIEEADKNEIDWKLVASIAHCESTGGKVTPQFGNKETYNAWGWAVYDNNSTTKKVNRYDMGSWENGIEIVSAGMKSYYKRGLTTPEQIVTRYTPASVRKGGGNPANAPWTKCILYTFDKIQSQQIELSDLNTNL